MITNQVRNIDLELLSKMTSVDIAKLGGADSQEIYFGLKHYLLLTEQMQVELQNQLEQVAKVQTDIGNLLGVFDKKAAISAPVLHFAAPARQNLRSGTAETITPKKKDDV